MRILTAALAAIMLTACSDSTHRFAPEAEASFDSRIVPEEMEAMQLPQAPRLLIHTGSAWIAVESVDDALVELEDLASGAGGYLDAVDFRQDDDERQAGSLSIRVPAAQFNTVVARLEEVGTVRNRSTNARDVTRDYFDLATRLAVKEAASVRLQSLVAMSADVEDLLAVERELTRVTTELESMKGEQRYLDDQISMAKLDVTLTEVTEDPRPAWSEPITSAFSSSMHVLGRSISALVYLIVFLVPWVALALLAWPAGARVRSRYARRR